MYKSERKKWQNIQYFLCRDYLEMSCTYLIKIFNKVKNCEHYQYFRYYSKRKTIMRFVKNILHKTILVFIVEKL